MIKPLLLATAVLVAAAVSAPASAREAPWCAVIDFGQNGAYWDCQYRSLAHCLPAITGGNRGFCNPNPAYIAPNPASKRKIHHRRRTRR